MKWCVFNHRDIGYCGTARQRSLQQIMAEHTAFGQATSQHRVYRLDVQQALAGEGALTKHILVNL